MKLRFLMFLARRCGRVSAFFIRLQTVLLTYAQINCGWSPADDAGKARLARRQFQLFDYRMAKAQLKKLPQG